MDEGMDGKLEKGRNEWETQMMERNNVYRGPAMSQPV